MKDIINTIDDLTIDGIDKKLSFWEILKNNSIFRKSLMLLALAFLWQILAIKVNNPLMLPTFTDTMTAMFDSLVTKNHETSLWPYLGSTMEALIIGFLIGVVIAVVTTIISVNSKLGEEFQSLITGLCTPLPAVAIAPIALLIFGLTFKTILFVVAWATAFPVALTLFMAFKTSSPTILNVGKNIGLKGIAYTLKIRIPDCLAEIYVGLRTGFSNGFRALVSLEIIIGSATGNGGLGWYIMSGKNQLDTPMVFAGIIATMLIGLGFEVLFTFIEKHTINKYGMSVDLNSK